MTEHLRRTGFTYRQHKRTPQIGGVLIEVPPTAIDLMIEAIEEWMVSPLRMTRDTQEDLEFKIGLLELLRNTRRKLKRAQKRT